MMVPEQALMTKAERMAESLRQRIASSPDPVRLLATYTSALLLAREAMQFCPHGCATRCSHTQRCTIPLAVINMLMATDY